MIFDMQDPVAVMRCAEILRRPGMVALVPTETVYGLVCRWDDTAAREKIYQLKHRDPNKLLAMFATTLSVAEAHGMMITPEMAKVAAALMPGPLTLIGALQENSGTIGLRIPDHPFIQALLAKLDFPLASTSANRSGSPDALTASEAATMLDGDVDICIDGGAIPPGRLASTVVNFSCSPWKVLRSGEISAEEIQKVIDEPMTDI